MQVARLTQNLSVAPQLTQDDLKQAAAAGFKSIINNRPDGESTDQPKQEEIAAAAARLGLDYRYVPVISGQLSDDQVQAFDAALKEMAGPALAFCRTGTRSATLWALASAGRMPVDDIMRKAADAGYNLDQLRPRLEAAALKGSAG